MYIYFQYFITFYIEGKLKIFFPIPIQELLFRIFQTDRYNHNTLEKSHNNNLNPDNKLKLKIHILQFYVSILPRKIEIKIGKNRSTIHDDRTNPRRARRRGHPSPSLFLRQTFAWTVDEEERGGGDGFRLSGEGVQKRRTLLRIGSIAAGGNIQWTKTGCRGRGSALRCGAV